MNIAKIVTRREVIKNAVRYTQQRLQTYPPEKKIHPGNLIVSEALSRLAVLDPDTCTEADFNDAVGFRGWAELKCDECGADQDTVIQIGEGSYDTSEYNLCLPCLQLAANTLRETGKAVEGQNP